MCDGTGFSFVVSSGDSTGIMGDEQKFAAGMTLRARFPVACDIRLLRDGKLITRLSGDTLEHSPAGPGVYRVEGWLTLDNEQRPWLCSNPIYLR
jgi:hypothetical protein